PVCASSVVCRSQIALLRASSGNCVLTERARDREGRAQRTCILCAWGNEARKRRSSLLLLDLSLISDICDRDGCFQQSRCPLLSSSAFTPWSSPERSLDSWICSGFDRISLQRSPSLIGMEADLVSQPADGADVCASDGGALSVPILAAEELDALR